jgi:hypothetical protein
MMQRATEKASEVQTQKRLYRMRQRHAMLSMLASYCGKPLERNFLAIELTALRQ